MKKEAGVIGGAMLGAIPGMMVGGYTGEVAGKIIHRKPTPEVVAEKNNYDKATKTYNDTLSKFNKKSNPMGVKSYRDSNGADELYNALLDDFSSDKYDHLSVAEIEDMASQKVHEFSKSLNKTASFKSTLVGAGISAVPLAVATGKMAYDNQKAQKKDPNYWKDRTKSQNNRINDINSMLSRNVEHVPFFEEYHSMYSPSVLMRHDSSEYDDANEFAADYGDIINNELSKKGINPRDLKWGEYKALTKKNTGNILNGKDVDLSLLKKYEKGNENMNKKAFNTVNTTFEKIAKAPAREEETRTRLGRDILVPELKRTPINLVTMGIGGAVGNAIKSKSGTKLVNDGMSGRFNKGAVVGMVGGHLAGKAVRAGLSGVVRAKKLKELNMQYGMPTTGADLRLNYGVTPQLFSSVSDASMGQRILHPIKNNLATPEAIVQAKRRKMENAEKKSSKEKKADEVVGQTFDKIAGIKDYKLRFTKDNPNKATQDEFNEYVALGAKIDKNKATKKEQNRFHELAPKIPDRYLSLPHFEKKAGLKDFGKVLKGDNVKKAKTGLANAEHVLSVANDSAKKAVLSGNPFAQAGLGNLYVDGAREDVMGAFANLGKEKMRTLKARAGVGAGIVGVGTGATYAVKKNKEK